VGVSRKLLNKFVFPTNGRNLPFAMQQDPFQGYTVRLKGQSTAWRRRLGKYRMIYDLYLGCPSYRGRRNPCDA